MKNKFERIEPTFNGSTSQNFEEALVSSSLKRSESPSLSKKILKSIAYVAMIVLVIFVTSVSEMIGKKMGSEIAQKNSSPGEVIQIAIDSLNENAPHSLGDGFTLLGGRRGAGDTFIYDYKMDETVLVPHNFLELQTEKLKGAYCGVEMRLFRDKRIAVEWHYKNGPKTHIVSLNPENCK